MKHKILIIIGLIFICFNNHSFAQQIGNGFAPVINDFTVPLNSGVYNGINGSQTNFPIGSTPDNSHLWQHLFVMRHNNLNNNNQLQIASSFAVNDKIYFRKIASGDLAEVPLTSSPWIELATRGTNTFIGIQQIKGNLSLDGGNPNSQIVFESQNGFHRIAFNELRFWDWQTGELMTLNNGNVGIGTTAPSAKLEVMGGYNDVSLNANSNATAVFRTPGHVQMAINTQLAAPYTTSLQAKHSTYDGNAYPLSLNPLGGNVGIGTTTPDEKLAVNGTIHSREVRVDLVGWPDYVFEKHYTGKSSLKPSYSLPTLKELEAYTKANHHLPEVPSAAEIVTNGLKLGEMNGVLLQKVEELTLYAIEQEKQNTQQNKEIAELKALVKALLEKK